MAGWCRRLDDGVALRVRLAPRGARDEIVGPRAVGDDAHALAARVRAAPDKGAANAALVRLIARALEVAPTTVSVASGHKARLKTVHVVGDPRTLAPRLAALAGPDKGDDE